MQRSAPKLWVLNLDAEQELATRGSYTQAAALGRIVAKQRLPLLGSLVAPGDFVVMDEHEASPVMRLDPDLSPGGARAAETLGAADAQGLARHMQPVRDVSVLRGLPGHAWSPTPSAVRRLEALGAAVAARPGIDVLRQVNARNFAAKLHADLPSIALTKHVALTVEDALAIMDQPAELGWLVRRSFGAAGRGRMRIASLAAHQLTSAEQSWLAASLAIGPVVLEPWVEVTAEFTRSAWLRPDGALATSAPCLQGTNDAGAWSGSRRVSTDEVSRADDETLGHALETAGRALHQAGYYGPFGIDAFRHHTGAGATALNPMSEINARFTMDWTCAMGAAPRVDFQQIESQHCESPHSESSQPDPTQASE